MKVEKLNCSLGYECGPIIGAIYKHTKAISRNVGKFVKTFKLETEKLDDSMSPKLHENLWKWQFSTEQCFE